MSRTATPAPHTLALHASPHFASWLAEAGASLAVTTYQAGKLLLIGTRPNGRLSVFERSLPRCMGLVAGSGALHVATLTQIWRFRDLLDGGEPAGGLGPYEGHDAIFAPRRCWVTGDLDVHDLALGTDGTPLFANTLFSCVAAASEDDSFIPLWRPPFISRLAAEDRCHLNGLAVQDGRPRYATVVGASDVADGWRAHREAGGRVIDLETNEVVCAGLSMPHAPRLHRGTLYVLNSGAGEFGSVDRATGRFEPIAFLPGYLRGLAFLGSHALVGLSLPRGSRTFTGLPLDTALEARGAAPRCAVIAIDLASGTVAHRLEFEGVVTELYDVAVLEGVRRPAAIGFLDGDIGRFVTIGGGTR